MYLCTEFGFTSIHITRIQVWFKEKNMISHKLEFIIESCKIYSKHKILITIFECVCVKESEIKTKISKLASLYCNSY